jgi:hypothetical protein
MEYGEFLKRKAIVDVPTGHSPKSLNPMLFDFQREITAWAIRRGRAAIFADCGLGKTPMQLVWADAVLRHTNKPGIILAPLAVSKQTKHEGEKFGVEVNICRSDKDVHHGINIANYEMMHNFDMSRFGWIVLDESSILKSYTGKYRNQIIDATRRIPYRLACTATPAPNDYMELGNHAEFLGVVTRSEMLSMFFINDTSNVGTWRLKGHGQSEFWKWLCSWAVMIGKPSDIGFEDNGFILPELCVTEHTVEYGKPLYGRLFLEPAETLSERREARRATIMPRCEKIAEMVNTSAEPWLVWCGLNDEGAALKRMIPDAVEVQGSDDSEHKESSMIGFSEGNIRVLITKSKIAGFGMNWQHCNNMAFAGLSDSYESYYQAIRRCWRFGQERPVNVNIVTSDLEQNVVENIRRKEKDATNMRDEMVKSMSDISSVEIRGLESHKTEYKETTRKGEGWTLHLGDSCEVIKTIPDNSIHYQIFSPPFASLFTYSNSDRDMGNARGIDEFFEHFDFLIGELLRVLIPGRVCSVHCMDLPATLGHDGFIGMKDFPGEIIRRFESHGWIYHSRVTIWKDPLIQAVRTKTLTLAHKQIIKDSTRCAQGMADYIVSFRKDGANPEPVKHPSGFNRYVGTMPFPKGKTHDDQRKNKQSHEIWQRYASPVWFDINQTRVLSTEIAREVDDEKHVCPLQLDTIERCLELWTNPGDTVLSPFAGIGSEIYCAVEAGRYGIGIELKESYFNQAVKNLNSIKRNKQQQELFT